jgi:Uma2 family endonuclease
MIAFGILTENHRVELIRGEVVTKTPISDRHIACVNRLNRLFNRLLRDSAIVSVQNPVRLPDSEPEPDIALLEPRADFYAMGKPKPANTLLVIEVTDASLEYDREVKCPMYADAGITEFWIVNLIDERLEVYRDPRPDETYGDMLSLGKDEQVTFAACGGHTLNVADHL